jgi:hypothetical protein
MLRMNKNKSNRTNEHKKRHEPGMVAHTYNSHYLGGGLLEDIGSRLILAKKMVSSFSTSR